MIAGVGRFLHTRPFHLARSKAHSWYKPNPTEAFFTHSSHVFLPQPLSLTPLTSTLLHAESQSLHISKPLQSASSYHICNAFNAKPTVEFCTGRSTLKVNTTHPPDHHLFCSRQSRHILHFHNPDFTHISQDSLNTSPVYSSFHFERNSLGVCTGANSLNLTHAQRTLALDAFSALSPAQIKSAK